MQLELDEQVADGSWASILNGLYDYALPDMVGRYGQGEAERVFGAELQALVNFMEDGTRNEKMETCHQQSVEDYQDALPILLSR